MEKNGADRYRGDFLKKKFKDLEVALQAREQAKAASTANTDRSVHGAASGSGTRPTIGTSTGVSGEYESPDKATSGGGNGTGNQRTEPAPSTKDAVLDKAATRAAINKAFNPAYIEPSEEPSDTPMTGTTPNPAPQQTKKRPNTATKDTGTAKQGTEATVSNPAKPTAKKVRKTLTPKSSSQPIQNGRKRKATVLKVAQTNGVADPEYIPLDD